MDKDYIISAAEEKGDGQFGTKRYSVRLEGVEGFVSLFAKFPPQAGKPIFGKVESVQKGDKTYLNFKFGKKDSSPALNNAATAELKNILALKVVPMLIEISEKLDTLTKTGIEYPEMDSTNDAHERDEH